MGNKPYYKNWKFWIIIILFIVIIGLFTQDTKVENNKVKENIISENQEYAVYKSVFSDGGKVKIEKIIVEDKNIEDEQIKEIFSERKSKNINTKLIIWLYSSDENLENMNTPEIAEVKEEDDGNIIINNYLKIEQLEEKESTDNEIQEEENNTITTTNNDINKASNVSSENLEKTKNSSTMNSNTNDKNSMTVYITPTGKRYHYSSTCGGKNSRPTTKSNAISRGLTPCKKCAN